jgi:DNA-binding NarL/FixJ family response regulator
MTNIILFEDKANMRESLKLLLENEPDFNISAILPNCIHAAEEILKHRPDVVLMDIDLPEVSGIEGVKNIKHVSPETQIVMLTVFEDDQKIFESIQAGADGYLLKKSIPSELIPAIRNTVLGGSPISPGIAAKVLNAFREKNRPKQNNFELSKREYEVLELLTKGYSYKKIAENLFVSVDTIGTHIKNIYSKLQVNSASEAVAKALKHRIIEL